MKNEVDYNNYKYIYPPNARKQEQLDIMIDKEKNNLDPLDPDVIDQDILYKTNYWYISENRFPYDGVEHQFLIIALDPIYDINDMSEEMWMDLFNIRLDLAKKYKIPGGAICFRFGNPAFSGASLKRLHAHIIVPKEEEKAKFSIGGHGKLKEGLEIK